MIESRATKLHIAEEGSEDDLVVSFPRTALSAVGADAMPLDVVGRLSLDDGPL